MNAIGYLSAPGIGLLQFDGTLIEGQGPHQCFAAVPCEEHLRGGLGLDIFLDELLQKLICDDMIAPVGVEFTLFQIVTILASQVTKRTCGLEHHVHGSSERCNGVHVCRGFLVRKGMDLSCNTQESNAKKRQKATPLLAKGGANGQASKSNPLALKATPAV